jgi:ADP-dependent NAD(P)H-hydrate dehydratase / NAD(P)H-hydrate epimerase
MQILNPEQIRAWDAFTITNEPVLSIDLMERAAARCVEWLMSSPLLNFPVLIFCGKGNNGGDGLAIARMLSRNQKEVKIFIIESGQRGVPDFEANLNRLHQAGIPVSYIQNESHFPAVNSEDLVIDAIFGSGLNRPASGVNAALIRHLNKCSRRIVSIDIPSGMFSSQTSAGCSMISALYTLTFQTYKLAFLMAENEPFCGKVVLLDIGLHAAFCETLTTPLELPEADFYKSIYRPRKSFAHKGTFGHALIAGGSYGKTGAMVLALRACLRAGVGLLTAFIPSSGYLVVQTAVPEAMAITDDQERFLSKLPADLSRYQAIGAGPGMGQEEQTRRMLRQLLTGFRKPLVLDADALNLIASSPDYWPLIPPFTILTPHPKEFDRLFGPSANDFERMERAREKAKALSVIIVLKGHRTFIAMPGGKGYFNPSGNPGMATGGSGDVLTGILTALLAQGYSSGESALLGVYLHGLAGDFAAGAGSEESLIASDLAEFLGAAFRSVGL